MLTLFRARYRRGPAPELPLLDVIARDVGELTEFANHAKARKKELEKTMALTKTVSRLSLSDFQRPIWPARSDGRGQGGGTRAD